MTRVLRLTTASGRSLSRRAARAAALIAVVTTLASPAARANDPRLQWQTIETEHFSIHFPSTITPVAQATADLVERVQASLEPFLGWKPAGKTELVLDDDSDAANGSATAYPYSKIRLFVTAPDDMSVLGVTDDWMLGLTTHEDTHILQMDNISGLPAAVNAVMGRVLVPNTAQPRWILEGLAVAEESRRAGTGRLHSAQFDMFLRADVVADNLAPLDQMSGPVVRWPGGSLAYLYGAYFVEFILDLYGPGTFGAVATDYGANLVPYGINRSIERVTGRTYPELYSAWKASLVRRYGEQLRAVERRGLREGTQLTRRGRTALYPRVAPRCAPGEPPSLVYYRSDGNSIGGLYRLPLVASPEGQEPEATLLRRTSAAPFAFTPSCELLHNDTAPFRNFYEYLDLFLLKQDGSDRRLTEGWRATDPDISADGRRVVFVTNRASTRTLRVADLAPDGTIGKVRTLMTSAPYEQVYTPRFSPDGARVAMSVWTTGGYRDIRIVDVETGKTTDLQHDRAMDQQPVWAPDGRRLFYVSDRTGIANVYARDLSTGDERMVTNVRMGAYMPALSEDGRTLYYTGYSTTGWDLWKLPLEPADWLTPEPYVSLDAKPPEFPRRNFPVTPYSAWPSLRPRQYYIDYAFDEFGDALSVRTTASDAVGLHQVSGTLIAHLESPEVEGAVDYAYTRLPFEFNASVFANASPRRATYYANNEVAFTERTTGASSSVSMVFPGVFESQSVSLGYSGFAIDGTVPAVPADPYLPVPRVPNHGTGGIVRLGYRYADIIRTAEAISNELGYELTLATDLASPETASDWTLTAFSGRMRGYVPMPWDFHQVLALALSGATASGTYTRAGYYTVGGYVDSSPVDDLINGVNQRAFVLRGYAPQTFFGRNYGLLNSEFRFPLWYVERGVSTLPVFWRTLAGNVFCDYGGAFDELDLDAPFDVLHVGVGAELWFHLVFLYFMETNLRVGYARGFGEEAIPDGQLYVVTAAAF